MPFLSICILVSACAAGPAPYVDGDPPPPRLPGASPSSPEVRVLVAEFASKHGLQTAYDSKRNRLELAKPDVEVILYPGTPVASVNGKRIDGMGNVRIYNGTWAFRPEDAVRVERALYGSLHARSAPGATAQERRYRHPMTAPDRAWKVKLRREWRFVVLHHSGTASGSADVFHRHHKEVRGWDGLGYHFVIGNGTDSGDGQVEVGYRWAQQRTGAHAGRGPRGSNLMNETGIGICLVGNFDDTVPTVRQKLALHRLLGFLESYCRIPADHVLTHRDLKVTGCPGHRFPAREFLVSRRSVPAGIR